MDSNPGTFRQIKLMRMLINYFDNLLSRIYNKGNGKSEKEINGYQPRTTNNIMELTAVIEALKLLSRPCEVIITTDSNYVKDGITKWIHNWKLKGWKTANRKSVKNKELWIELNQLTEKHQTT